MPGTRHAFPYLLLCCLVAQLCLTLATPWTIACQVPLSWDTGVCCHFLLFLTQGLNLPLLLFCVAGGFFATEPPGKPLFTPYNHSIGKALLYPFYR